MKGAGHVMLDEAPPPTPTRYLGLGGLDQDFADLEVERLVVPSAGQDEVAHAGQGVAHQEVAVPQNQSL